MTGGHPCGPIRVAGASIGRRYSCQVPVTTAGGQPTRAGFARTTPRKVVLPSSRRPSGASLRDPVGPPSGPRRRTPRTHPRRAVWAGVGTRAPCYWDRCPRPCLVRMIRTQPRGCCRASRGCERISHDPDWPCTAAPPGPAHSRPGEEGRSPCLPRCYVFSWRVRPVDRDRRIGLRRRGSQHSIS